MSGELPGRQSQGDIVVFKSNGIAAWDVAIAAAAVDRARERGVGLALWLRKASRSRRGVLDGLVAERLDQLRPVEHAQTLSRAEPVLHVAVLEDLAEAAPAACSRMTYAATRSSVLVPAKRNEKGAQQDCESLHSDDCILATVRRKSTEGRFAERVVHWVDDAGAAETIVIWIERKQARCGPWAGPSTWRNARVTSRARTTISSRATSSTTRSKRPTKPWRTT